MLTNNFVGFVNPTYVCSSGTSLVGVVHGVRVTPSLAFYGSDPMHLLAVPDLLLYIELAYCTGSTSSRSQLTI